MTASNPYRGFRYPAEVIQHAVWLYHCFSLSLRDCETILAVYQRSREPWSAQGARYKHPVPSVGCQRNPGAVEGPCREPFHRLLDTNMMAELANPHGTVRVHAWAAQPSRGQRRPAPD